MVPTIVKLEHQQKHHTENIKDQKNTSTLGENCPICNFEFSLFTPGTAIFNLQYEELPVFFFEGYQSPAFTNPFQFSYSFRAPPV